MPIAPPTLIPYPGYGVQKPKSPLFAVRFRQTGWAPVFMSWHKSEAAAMRAAKRYAKTKTAGVLEVLEM